MTADYRAEEIAALRRRIAVFSQLADAAEASPEAPVPYLGDEILIYAASAEQLAAAARALPCTWTKEATEKWLNLHGEIDGVRIQLYADRGKVCTRRVVGTEDREVDEVVTPAVTRKVTKPVDIVEWDCHPIMRDRTPIGGAA